MPLDLNFDDMPDSPPPPTEAKIADTFDYPVGFKFAFVGVGQAGGRIANTFKGLGYARTCAINTAMADLAELKEFPDYAKLDVGQQQGAGKDPLTAAKIVSDKDGEIFDLYTRTWGDDVDYAFVCLSGAGGTGAGAYAKVAAVAKEYMRSHKRVNRVGCIMALPKDADGQRGAKNVIHSLKQLQGLNLSPIIFIDNEKYKQLYGQNVSVAQEKPASNMSTAKLLHMFNRLAGTESENVGGTTFDPTDFSRILDSGVIAFASTTVTKWESPADITTPIRERLKENVLASVDMTKGSVAGLLYIISGAAWDGPNAIKVGHLDHGTEMMNSLLAKKDSVVFPGIYPTSSPESNIKIFAMIGGLPMPIERIKELANRAGEAQDSIQQHFGI